MQFSIVMNTYNRAHFLPRALAAWTRVSGHAFTMIVADDGSTDGTDALLREMAPELGYPIVHVYHPDEGHRRAEILNKAVHAADEEAVLFTDADTLPAADVLDVYSRYFEDSRFLFGGYLRLSEDYTERLDLERTRRGDYEAQLGPAGRRELAMRHFQNVAYQVLRKPRRPHVMGLNMCIPKSKFVAVNGYDNKFRGWGRADGNLRERLKRIGVRPYSIWNKALVFHMHHPEDPTKKRNANSAYGKERHPTVAVDGYAQVEPDVVFSTRG